MYIMYIEYTSNTVVAIILKLAVAYHTRVTGTLLQYQICQ